MNYTNYFSMETTAIISGFALAWFLIGLVIGRRMRTEDTGSDEERIERHKKHGGKRRGRNELIELYVGNLSYDMSEKELLRTFQQFGDVASARVIKNHFSGKSKGFGFVEMSDRDEANAAISSLNGKDMKGRRVVVNEAKSKGK